jgi:hypothetical protein
VAKLVESSGIKAGEGEVSAVTENARWISPARLRWSPAAGKGIGRAASAAFARHGAKVVVVDRDAAGAEATAGIIRQSGGEAAAVTADVTRRRT